MEIIPKQKQVAFRCRSLFDSCLSHSTDVTTILDNDLGNFDGSITDKIDSSCFRSFDRDGHKRNSSSFRLSSSTLLVPPPNSKRRRYERRYSKTRNMLANDANITMLRDRRKQYSDNHAYQNQLTNHTSNEYLVKETIRLVKDLKLVASTRMKN